jgi:hypothetical protein
VEVEEKSGNSEMTRQIGVQYGMQLFFFGVGCRGAADKDYD